MVKELRNRARDVLLTQAIASEENARPADAGGGPADAGGHGAGPGAARWPRRGVRTREDLADQAVDELLDIEGLSTEERRRS